MLLRNGSVFEVGLKIGYRLDLHTIVFWVLTLEVGSMSFFRHVELLAAYQRSVGLLERVTRKNRFSLVRGSDLFALVITVSQTA